MFLHLRFLRTGQHISVLQVNMSNILKLYNEYMRYMIYILIIQFRRSVSSSDFTIRALNVILNSFAGKVATSDT